METNPGVLQHCRKLQSVPNRRDKPLGYETKCSVEILSRISNTNKLSLLRVEPIRHAEHYCRTSYAHNQIQPTMHNKHCEFDNMSWIFCNVLSKCMFFFMKRTTKHTIFYRPHAATRSSSLHTLSVSCSILDNEYTILFDTCVRIPVGIDRRQCNY